MAKWSPPQFQKPSLTKLRSHRRNCWRVEGPHFRENMIGQRHCPYCQASALAGCAHLALAAEARDFVPRCVESCKSGRQWNALCQHRRGEIRGLSNWTPEREDFMWLETAFCNEFLRHLRWFGGM